MRALVRWFCDGRLLAARRDNRVLVARLRVAEAVVVRLRGELAARDAEPRVAGRAMADNIRLAHQLEVAEARLAELEGAS